LERWAGGGTCATLEKEARQSDDEKAPVTGPAAGRNAAFNRSQIGTHTAVRLTPGVDVTDVRCDE